MGIEGEAVRMSNRLPTFHQQHGPRNKNSQRDACSRNGVLACFIRIILYIPEIIICHIKLCSREKKRRYTHLDSPVGFNGVSSQHRVPSLNGSSIPIISTSCRVLRYSAIVLWYPWYPLVIAMHFGWQHIKACSTLTNKTV